MTEYSPFAKDLVELRADDLAILRERDEGWFLEYKRDVPNARTIAKSISSFANHNGGWLFFGVQGGSGGDTKAQAFPGLPRADWSQLQERISSAVSANISPTPHFECRLVEGPSGALALSGDYGVVVIQIPRGHDTPYVHSSGRIYRRVADQSDPVHEADRAVLDQLWHRRTQAAACLETLLLQEPTLSKAEESLALLTVHLIPDPLGDRGFRSSIDLDRFRSIMSTVAAEHSDFACDTFFSVPGGYVARQVAENDPGGMSLTVQHMRVGTTIAHIPVRSGGFDSEACELLLQHYDQADAFIERCTDAGCLGRRWLDLNLLFSLLVGVISKHDRLLREGGIQSRTFFKGRFRNVWRCVPFVDTASYMSQLASDGIPLLQDSDYFFRPGTDPSSLFEIVDLEGDEVPAATRRAALPWALALQAVGLEKQTGPEGIADLLGAALRGTRAHRSPATPNGLDEPQHHPG